MHTYPNALLTPLSKERPLRGEDFLETFQRSDSRVRLGFGHNFWRFGVRVIPTVR